MSTPFKVMAWARQAGIRMTGGFAVVAECVTLDELERFAQIAISQAISNTPQIAINPEVIGYVAPQREWKGLTEEEITTLDMETSGTTHDFVHAIEAKLKELNHDE